MFSSIPYENIKAVLSLIYTLTYICVYYTVAVQSISCVRLLLWPRGTEGTWRAIAHECILSRFSRVRLFATLQSIGNFSGKTTRGSCHFLPQRTLPTQELNLHFLHWHMGSLPLMGSLPSWKWKLLSCVWLCDAMDYIVHGILQARILEWVAFSFSRASSQSRDRTRSPTLQANSLPAEPSGKPCTLM